MQGTKKFIAPDHWFTMMYPAHWQESVDEEGCFLFYDPDVWTGNFRISAFRGHDGYGMDTVREELKTNPDSRKVKVGDLDCAYAVETFEENAEVFVQHIWVAGIRDVAFECSFTIKQGASIAEAEKTIASLQAPVPGEKYPVEITPIRLSEICQIDEAFDFVTRTVKEQLKKDFTGAEEDIPLMQTLIDRKLFGPKNRDAWMSIGITLCVILTNEVEGVQWLTLFDGNREAPVLQYENTDDVIDPLKLVWSRVRAGEQINLAEIYQNLL